LYCFARVPPQEESTPTPRRRSQQPKPPTQRNRRLVQLALLFVASVIVVDGLVGERGLLAILRARQEGERLAATIAHQRLENARLREEARRLREDPTAVEEVARRELGLIKPGERVFIVKDIPAPKP
jgi:cell division protein FtsB